MYNGYAIRYYDVHQKPYSKYEVLFIMWVGVPKETVSSSAVQAQTLDPDPGA